MFIKTETWIFLQGIWKDKKYDQALKAHIWLILSLSNLFQFERRTEITYNNVTSYIKLKM